jgi:methyl-accepting chemotaxis protein
MEKVRLNVRAKLLVGFMAINVLLGVVGILGVTGANSINSMLDDLYSYDIQSLSHVKEANVDQVYVARGVRNSILMSDPADIQAAITDVQQNDQQFRTNMAEYQKLVRTQEGRESLAKVLSDYEQYKGVVDQVLVLAKDNRDDEAVKVLTDAGTKVTAIANELAGLADLTEVEAKQTYAEAGAVFARARLLIILVGAFAVISGVVVALWLGSNIASRIALLLEMIEKISVGDLNREMSEETKLKMRGWTDELGAMARGATVMIKYLQDCAEDARRVADRDLTVTVEPRSEKDELGHALFDMVGNLRGLIGQIKDSAGQVANASEQLASAAEQSGSATTQVTSTIQQVAQGTATQASSTTEVTASMDDIARKVVDIQHGAEAQAESVSGAGEAVNRLQNTIGEANRVTEITAAATEQVVSAAKAGAATVKNTSEGMDAINQSTALVAQRVREMGQRSEEIGKIVSTIQDIADQTNLLALNAAIEAARAGEQGRGFAVVADEVRKLAEKSGASSREIADLVRAVQRGTEDAVKATEESASNVARGVGETREAGRALAEILAAAQQNSLSIADFRAATAKVTELAGQVAEGLRLVTSEGEKNLAATQEMTASIGEVAQAMGNVASVSEENSASVEEVSATAEELAAQVEEVSSSAEELAALSEELQAAVNTFQLVAAEGAGQKAAVSRGANAQWQVKRTARPSSIQAAPGRPGSRATDIGAAGLKR